MTTTKHMKAVSRRHPVRRNRVQRSRAMMEALEERRLFSLVGVEVGVPQMAFIGAANTLNYNAAAQTLTATGIPTSIFIPPPKLINAPSSFNLSIQVNNSGALLGGTNSDLVITGTYDVNNSGIVEPAEIGAVLLQGKALQFGFQDAPASTTGGNAAFDFRFQVTGGLLAATLFSGSDIGMLITAEGCNFPGNFQGNFTGQNKGTLSPIPTGGNPPLTIEGFKFWDKTGDGKTGDDTGLAGVQINLYKDDGDGTFDAGDAFVVFQTTDANGHYVFGPLEAGIYFVTEDVPAGYVQVGPAAGHYTIDGSLGGTVQAGDFLNFKLFSISGRKVQDLTGDGLSNDDTPLSGVEVQLYKDDGNGNFVAQGSPVLTGADGSYSFSGLTPGIYKVAENVPNGYEQTFGVGGYVVNTNADSINNDFANFKLFAISGRKSLDITGGGLSNDDTPLSGVEIKLFKDTGGGNFVEIDSAFTGADGSYAFTGLSAGIYKVEEIVPNGYSQTFGVGGYTVTSNADSTGNDFANFKLFSISGKKFLDLTKNGLSNDDLPLANFEIQLYKQNGNGVFQPVGVPVTTGVDGSYSFVDLEAGIYRVEEVNQAGFIQTVGVGGYVVDSNTDSTGNNFANFLGGNINGKKVQDKSGNGLSDDDIALGGWTIKLFQDNGTEAGKLDAGDTFLTSTTTAAGTGAYEFTNLVPGNYIVQEVGQSGYIQTWPVSGTYAATINASEIIDITAGTVKADVEEGKDFANFKKDDCKCELVCYYYVINDCYKVTDLTGKVKQGDTVKVVFTLSSSATLSFVSYTAPNKYFEADKAYLQEIYDVKTGTFGKGTWSMTVKVPNCYFQVDFICGLPIDQFGPAGSNIFYTPQCRLIDADNGGTNPCGQTPDSGDACISGTVYADCDNDGVKDSGEAGIKGVKVVLTGVTTGGTQVTLTTYTDSYGNYKFSNLKAGTYKVTEYTPSKYYDGKDAKGTAGGTLGNDVISNIVLGAGVKATGYNFGELKGASIAGKVFFDKDKDGKIDSGESGLACVKLTLSGYDDLGNWVTRTTYTDAYGNYCFGDLRAGLYTLCEVTPSGYSTTKNTAGTEGGTVSGDKISGISLEWCDAAAGYNFGEYKKYSYC